uniref:Guided entry of tail-anchored proteins factor 1 n=1 Tax=Catagonus wagneri TaxID=51154 RepID=A0A8C3WGU4_9CETA
MSRVLQKDAEQESQMRAEIQEMRQELSTVNMMDEFARYARLERKINKMTDKLKTHVKARTAQLAKIKWMISVAFYILQVSVWLCHLGSLKLIMDCLQNHVGPETRPGDSGFFHF